jgi:D-alanine-D-alanine ligase
MKCCILYNQPGENALADEMDIIEQVEYVEKHLHQMSVETYRKGITNNFMNELSDLSQNKPDFVFNLVESINNQGELLYFVPAILNMYSIPYTGNPLEAMFITTSKALTNKILEGSGLSAPKAFLPSKAKFLEPGKKYIIKPIWEDGSMGITADSVFIAGTGSEERLSEYSDTHWIIQEFIDGREFNASVLGNRDLDLVEISEITYSLPPELPRILTFESKWFEETDYYKGTGVTCPAALSEKLREVVVNAVLTSCRAAGCRGYARVDLRQDKDGSIKVIEVNANPDLTPELGIARQAACRGMTYADLIQKIVDLALE